MPAINPMTIYDALFGKKDAAQDAKGAMTQSLQDMINARKTSAEQERTDAIKMAKYNALGNVLTSLVQPIGWAIGGSTAPVQTTDNRQYIDAFNRAVKANDDIRNIGNIGAEYNFKLAEDEYRRQLALKDYEDKARLNAQIQSDYAQQRHDYTMAEIDARGDYQKAVAEIRAKNRITKNGKSADDQNLKTAYTEYRRYLRRYWDQVGVGIQRTEKSGPLSFEQFLGTPEGGGYAIEPVAKQDNTPTAAKPAGSRTTANLGNNTSTSKSGRSTAKL